MRELKGSCWFWKPFSLKKKSICKIFDCYYCNCLKCRISMRKSLKLLCYSKPIILNGFLWDGLKNQQPTANGRELREGRSTYHKKISVERSLDIIALLWYGFDWIRLHTRAYSYQPISAKNIIWIFAHFLFSNSLKSKLLWNRL